MYRRGETRTSYDRIVMCLDVLDELSSAQHPLNKLNFRIKFTELKVVSCRD